MASIAAQLVGAVLLPAFVVAAIPRGWLWRAMLLWFGVPIAACLGILLLGVPSTPHGADAMGRNLYNLAFLFPLLAIPFLAVSGLALALGLLLRRLLKRDRRSLEFQGWHSPHMGRADDALRIGGRSVWMHPWRPVGLPPVRLPHPLHAGPTRLYDIHEIGAPDTPTRFAANELSPGIWAFWTPGARAALGGPDPSRRLLSPDGRIAVDLAPMEWRHGHWIHAPRVTDLSTGRVLLDLHGADWDATADFPAAGQVVLGLRGQATGASLALEMDLDFGTCRIRTGPTPREAWPAVPLDQAAAQIAAAVAGFEAAAAARRPAAPGKPHAFAAWRAALVILVLALAAIVLLGWLSATHGWQPPPSPRALLRSILP
jgi:hypothetical protein